MENYTDTFSSGLIKISFPTKYIEEIYFNYIRTSCFNAKGNFDYQNYLLFCFLKEKAL